MADTLNTRPSLLVRLRDAPALAPRLGAAAARLADDRLGPRARGARLHAILVAAFPDLAADLARAPLPARGAAVH